MTTPRVPFAFPARPVARPAAGMTLIEVLVALLIFSFGVLGLVGLQGRALQYSTSAQDSNRAALLANEIAFQMLNANTVDPANSAAAASAYSAWQARVADPTQAGLPNGSGSVVASGTVGVVSITWQAPNSTTTNRFATQVVLPQ